MKNQPEKALKALLNPIIEATIGMSPEEAAEFFDLLSDWASGQYESCLIDREPETQEYEED